MVFFLLFFTACSRPLLHTESTFACPKAINLRQAKKSNFKHYSDDILLLGYKIDTTTDYIFQFNQNQKDQICTNAIIQKRITNFNFDSIANILAENHLKISEIDTSNQVYWKFFLINSDNCIFNCNLKKDSISILSCHFNW